MTRQDTSSDSDTNRRTDRRTVEEQEQPHYSAREVYVRLGCPYPGETSTESTVRSTDRTHIFYNLTARGVRKVRDSPTEETGVRLPVSSATNGIKIPFASSGCAVRRRTWFSGFETSKYARYDRTNGGEERRSVTDSERLREVSDE